MDTLLRLKFFEALAAAGGSERLIQFTKAATPGTPIDATSSGGRAANRFQAKWSQKGTLVKAERRFRLVPIGNFFVKESGIVSIVKLIHYVQVTFE